VTSDERTNLQASVRQRLLNIAQRDGADFQLVLTRFGLERFLHRLGRSPHKEAFLLKGAFLFHAWREDVGRPTRDLDLLGHGSPDIARLEAVIADIAGTDVEDDGLDFRTDGIRGEAIREAALYDGIRIRLDATLGRARIPLQIDVGFGDAASPEAVELEYPTLLDQTPPTILAYRPEYVVAAIKATFAQRGSAIPTDVPPGLADTFADPGKSGMWSAFLERNGLDERAGSLTDVVRDLRSTLGPLLEDAGRGSES
jgi:hypothetical protein